MGVSLETCSLVPLTSSWTNACPSVGAPGKEIQSGAEEREKQMVGGGCIARSIKPSRRRLKVERDGDGAGRGEDTESHL